MLRFHVDVASTDTARRLIEGVAVPYGETAEIGFGVYRFAPASLRRARAITPLLLGHDTNTPVGVLSELIDSGERMRVRFRVDKTPDGDKALEQARSGSRAGLSVGFEIGDSRESADGVTEILEASLYEVSLVAVPAFAGAQVERVAAQLETSEPPPGDDDGDDADGEEDDEEEDEDEEGAGDGDGETDGGAPAEPTEGDGAMSEAHSPRILVAERDRPRRDLSAGEYVRLSIEASHGDSRAASMLAALTESISTEVTGLLPPSYEGTVIGGKQIPRPLYTFFRSRALPGVGLQVNKPKWTTPPNGAWAANVDADATSTKVVVGSQAATVQRWDWAGAIPWVVVQRSDPSIIDEVYG